jgi:hypothetical protein
VKFVSGLKSNTEKRNDMAKGNLSTAARSGAAVADQNELQGDVTIETRPASGDKKLFDVTHGGTVHRVEAVDSLEAWALVCDGLKSWPSPKSGKVEEVK